MVDTTDAGVSFWECHSRLPLPGEVIRFINWEYTNGVPQCIRLSHAFPVIERSDIPFFPVSGQMVDR